MPCVCAPLRREIIKDRLENAREIERAGGFVFLGNFLGSESGELRQP